MEQSKNSLKKPLFISVILNVFLIGFLISTQLMHPMHRPPPHKKGSLQHFERAKKHLSKDGQVIVSQILSERREKLKGNADQIHNTIHKAERILLAPELDQNALLKVHEDMDQFNVAITSELSETIYQIAVKLSSEDRMKFFQDALPKRPPHDFQKNRK